MKLIGVWAGPSFLGPPNTVIAAHTHLLGVMATILVRTSHDFGNLFQVVFSRLRRRRALVVLLRSVSYFVRGDFFLLLENVFIGSVGIGLIFFFVEF